MHGAGRDRASRQSGSDGAWLETLARVADVLASHGRLNFLMSDCVHLIAYAAREPWVNKTV